MIGQTVSHYKILEKLGEGGMGVVYKAEDTKLDRFVALKFLSRHLSQSEEEKKRFIHEAKAASALDHNNICTVYEIDETEDGQMFIAMACYEGESLKEKIERGPMAIEEAIDIATQISRGLAKAHSKQITHRDIKPANLLIAEDDTVKIVDFGLAKLAGRTVITKEGTTLGTASYMSPEQTKGAGVDHRTDIWALGVVLYEMISGKQPFQGDYEQAVLYSIMNEDPEPVTGLRTGVPMELERIVNKALKKNSAERYQHIDELYVDLKSASEDSAAGKDRASDNSSRLRDSIQRLAVLPFTNIRNDPQTDFLGFALADQIIGSLSYLKNILVRPSSSIRQYQNQILDPKAAGADLKVEIILTGNYLKEANTIRLNIELVDVDANEIIWREPIEVEYKNTFALQDIVSEKVIDRLKLQFSQDERARMQSDVSQNPLAYEYYLRGLSYPSTTEGDLLAIEMLNNSIQLDSSYAPAFAELGYHQHRYGSYGLAGAQEISKAEQAYLRALSLNDELLNALQNLSTLYTETARTEKAVELARRMLTINPNSASAHFSLGYVYRFAGMLEESEKECDRALAIDPGNPRFRSAGLTYRCLGKYEKAIQACNLDKGSSFALIEIATIFYRQGEKQKAIEMWNTLLAQESKPGFYLFLSTAWKAFAEGETETARAAITEFEQTIPTDGELWFILAEIYGLLGDAASTARALEEGVNRGYFNYPFMVSNSFFDRVRSAPEFQRVLEMAKLRHEAFKEKFFSE